MNKLTELLQQIKQQINQNNTGLTSEDNRLQDLSQRCDNITNHLTQIEQVWEQLNKFSNGIEVAPEDIQRTLRELKMREVTGDGLRLKFEEILQLATNGNEELANKIKETESELEQILTALQNQQTIITNYQDQITTLETKVKSNENQAKSLQIKAVALGVGIGGLTGGLLLIIAKFWKRFKRPRK